MSHMHVMQKLRESRGTSLTLQSMVEGKPNTLGEIAKEFKIPSRYIAYLVAEHGAGAQSQVVTKSELKVRGAEDGLSYFFKDADGNAYAIGKFGYGDYAVLKNGKRDRTLEKSALGSKSKTYAFINSTTAGPVKILTVDMNMQMQKAFNRPQKSYYFRGIDELELLAQRIKGTEPEIEELIKKELSSGKSYVSVTVPASDKFKVIKDEVDLIAVRKDKAAAMGKAKNANALVDTLIPQLEKVIKDRTGIKYTLSLVEAGKESRNSEVKCYYIVSDVVKNSAFKVVGCDDGQIKTWSSISLDENGNAYGEFRLLMGIKKARDEWSSDSSVHDVKLFKFKFNNGELLDQWYSDKEYI